MRGWVWGMTVAFLLASCERYDSPPSASDGILSSCCEELGRCVPEPLVPEDERSRLDRDACATALLCLPHIVFGEPIACRTAFEAEGRCLPECLPEIAEQVGSLRQSSCPTSMRCAPCFDPRTGEPTGACSLTRGDAPSEPAVRFSRCCGGDGLCVPSDELADFDPNSFARDTCEEPALCVPEAFASDPRYVPPTCTLIAGAEGRCLSTCLPAIASELDRLPRATCSPTEVCAPCFDAFTGDPTGACDTPGDPGPAKPPHVFGRCCPSPGGPRGTCLPRSVIPETLLAPLSTQECAADELCAPDALVRPDAPNFPACTSYLGAGACVAMCFIPTELVWFLEQSTCDSTARCVPCVELGPDVAVCDSVSLP